MRTWLAVLFACSGLVPLLGLLGHPPDVMLLIYSVFVLAWFLRVKLGTWVGAVPGTATSRLVLSFIAAGMLAETLAWLNNYLKAAPLPVPGLFHPQLFADLIVGFGFYGGWALAWLIALRWFRFALWQCFVVTGIQGIFFEQLGAVFVAMVRAWTANPLLSLLLGLYVFAVHGAVVGLGMVPVLPRLNRPQASQHWSRFPSVVGLMVALAFAGSLLVGLIARIFGGLPEKRSIIDHPFW